MRCTCDWIFGQQYVDFYVKIQPIHPEVQVPCPSNLISMRLSTMQRCFAVLTATSALGESIKHHSVRDSWTGCGNGTFLIKAFKRRLSVLSALLYLRLIMRFLPRYSLSQPCGKDLSFCAELFISRSEYIWPVGGKGLEDLGKQQLAQTVTLDVPPSC